MYFSSFTFSSFTPSPPQKFDSIWKQYLITVAHMEEVSQCLKGIVGGEKGVGRDERGCDTGQSWCRFTEWFSEWPVMTGVDACGVHMSLYPHKVLSTICCGQLSWMKMGWILPLDSSLNPAISNQSLRLHQQYSETAISLAVVLSAQNKWFFYYMYFFVFTPMFSHIPIIFKTKTVILFHDVIVMLHDLSSFTLAIPWKIKMGTTCVCQVSVWYPCRERAQ